MAVNRQESARIDAGGINCPIGVIDPTRLVHDDLATIDDDITGRASRQATIDGQGRTSCISVTRGERVVGGIPRLATGDGDDPCHIGRAQRAGPEREIGIHPAIEMQRRPGAANHGEPEVGAGVVDQALQDASTETPTHRRSAHV